MIKEMIKEIISKCVYIYISILVIECLYSASVASHHSIKLQFVFTFKEWWNKMEIEGDEVILYYCLLT